MRYTTDKDRHEKLDFLFSFIRTLEGAEQNDDVRRLIADYEQEAKELIHEELVAHSEEVTQSPDGSWALNEHILKQKSVVN